MYDPSNPSGKKADQILKAAATKRAQMEELTRPLQEQFAPLTEYETSPELRQHRADNQQYFLEQELKRNSQLVQDHELDSLGGNLKNMGLKGAEAIREMAGNLAGAAAETVAGSISAQVDDQTRAKYNQIRRNEQYEESLQQQETDILADEVSGAISPEQAARARANIQQARNLPGPAYHPVSEQTREAVEGDGYLFKDAKRGKEAYQNNVRYETSARDLLDDAAEKREFSRDMRDWGTAAPWANESRVEAFREQFGEDYKERVDAPVEAAKAAFAKGDKATGSKALLRAAAEFAAVAGISIKDNPGAVVDIVGELAGDLAAAAFRTSGLLLTGAAEATRVYGEALEYYEDKNNGAIPTRGEEAQMLGAAALSAGAEFALDASILGKFKKAKTKEELIAADDKQSGKTKLAKRVARPVAETAKTGAAGLVTGGIQEYAETDLAKLTGEISDEEIAFGALAEGVGGGTLGGALSTAGAIAGASPEGLELDAAYRKENAEKAKAADNAAVSGDFSALLDDPKADTYSPFMAAVAAAKRMQDAELKPKQREEAKQTLDAALEKATEQLEDTRVKYELTQPASKKRMETAIAEAKETIKEAEKGSPEYEAAQKTLDYLPKELDGINKMTDTAVKRLKSSLAAQKKEVEAIRDIRRDLEPEKQTETRESLITAVEAVRDRAGTEADIKSATERVIVHAMDGGEELDPDAADALSEDTGADLTSSQRKVLKTYAANARAKKEMQAVSTDIYSGGEGFRGLTEYDSGIVESIGKDDKARTNTLMTQLGQFAKGHRQKANLARQALTEIGDSSERRFLVNKGNGQWEMSATKPDDFKKLRDSGQALVLNKNANQNGLIDNIEKEADAIQASLEFNRARVAAGSEARQAPEQEGEVAEPREEVPEATDEPEVEAAEPTEETTTETESEAEPDVAEEAPQTQPEQAAETETVTEDAVAGSTQPAPEAEETSAPSQAATEGGDVDAEPTLQAVGTDADNDPSQLSTEDFRSTQKVRRYFRQSAGSKRAKTYKPLAAVKDFASTLRENPELLKDFFKQEGPLSAGQSALMREVLRRVLKSPNEGGWGSLIESNFQHSTKVSDKTTEQALEHRNWGRALLNEDGTLDENVKTAITVAAISYLADIGGGPGYSTKSEIRSLLGLDESASVPRATRDALATAGNHERRTINQLGESVMEMLGLEPVEGAPENVGPAMAAALGSQVALVLYRQHNHQGRSVNEAPLVERHKLPNDLFADADIQAAGSRDTDLNPEPSVSQEAKEGGLAFIRANREWDGKTNPLKSEWHRRVVEAHKGNHSFLSEVFGAPKAKKAPTEVPQTFKQKLFKRTKELVPSWLGKVLNTSAKRPYSLSADMVKLVESIPREAFLEMFGYENPDEVPTIDALRLTQQSKNVEVERDYENFMAFLSGLSARDAKFHFSFSAWSNGRVGIDENLVNPQTSKMHRWMMGMDAWKTRINPHNMDSPENQQFMLALGQALGVKIDRMGYDAAYSELMTKVNTPEIAAGIEVIGRALNAPGDAEAEGFAFQELSPEDQRAVIDAVKAGGEGGHSLRGLVNYARFIEVQQNTLNSRESASVEVDLPLEVDGVTNGPALTHVLLAAGPELWEKFGFYGDSAEEFNKFISRPGAQDLYETLADTVIHHIGKAVRGDKALSRKLGALNAFTNNFMDQDLNFGKGARKFVKQPLTAMIFGSSPKNAVKSMANDYIDNVYQAVNTALREDPLGAESVLADIDALLAAAGSKTRVNMSQVVDDLYSFALAPADEAKIRNLFESALGKQIEAALEEQFSTVIERRKAINEASELGYRVYNRALKFVTERHIKQLAAAGELPVSRKGAPVMSLNAEQQAAVEREVAELLPINVGPMALRGGAGIESGLSWPKSERRPAGQTDNGYGQEVRSRGEIPTSFHPDVSNRTKASRLLARGFKRYMSAPGVRAVINNAHNLDSTISHTALAENEALNVHDAHVIGIADAVKGAQNLNKATYEQLVNFSLPGSMADSLDRIMEGADDLLVKYPEFQAELDAALGEFWDRQGDRGAITVARHPRSAVYLKDYAQAFRQQMLLTELAKLTELEKINAVDQYAHAGGSYVVDEAVKQQLADRITAVRAALADVQERGVDPAPEDFQPAPEVPDDGWPEATDYGRIGEPKNPSNVAMTQVLQKRGRVSAKTLLGVAARELRNLQPSASSEFQIRLIDELRKRVDDGLQVELITPKTTTKAPRGIKTARGFSTKDRDGNWVIRVKSPDFVHSGIDPELLAHEVLHTLVSDALATERKNKAKNPNYTSPALEAMNDLEELRVAAKASIEGDSGIAGLRNATKDVDELISWGMTSKKFQGVLKKLSITAGEPGKTMDGMRRFVRSLMRLVFGRQRNWDKDQLMSNGMTVLMTRTATILEAARLNEESQARALHAMDDSDVRGFTTAQTFDGLGAIDPKGRQTNSSRLQGLMESVVTAAHGPFGALRQVTEREATLSAEDAFLNAIQAGEAPYASEVAAKLPLSYQEAFALESIEVTMEAAIGQSSQIREEVRKLYSEARKVIRTPADLFPGDWLAASGDERAKANDLFNELFNLSTSRDPKRHLSKFVALALAYQPVYDKLGQLPAARPEEGFRGKSLAQIVEMLFNRAMSILRRATTGVSDYDNPQDRLVQLSHRLAQIEGRRKEMLGRSQGKAAQAFNAGQAALSQGVRKAVISIAESKLVSNTGNAVVGAVAQGASLVAKDQAEALLDNIMSVRNRMFKERQGFLASMVTEMKGPEQQFQQLLMMVNRHEQQRKARKDRVTKMVREAFAQRLSDDQMSDITRVLLKTDIDALTDKFDQNQLADLLTDRSALQAEIDKRQAALPRELKGFYIEASKGLATYMVNGRVTIPHLLLNADNIARLLGTPQQVDENVATEVAPVIDELVSLYALRYLGQRQAADVADIMRAEAARSDGNGIEFVLGLHKGLKKDAKESNFRGVEAHFVKGYIKETFDPNVDIREANAKVGAQLERAGYVRVTDALPKDSSDPSRDDTFIYKRMGGGLKPWVTGIMSTLNNKQKGSAIHGGINPLGSDEPNTFAKRAQLKANQQKAQEIASMVGRSAKRAEAFDPDQVQGTYMVPVLNPQGEVVNYRYMMNQYAKDQFLNPDMRADTVLGAMAGNLFDKLNAPELNRAGIDALRTVYKDEYSNNHTAFIEFGPESTDPKIRETYQMLPEDTKKHIREVWGRNGMKVRADLYDMTFGYRKWSITETFDKDASQRNMWEKLQVAVALNTLGRLVGEQKMLGMLRATEDVWQELVKEVKDIWVIKNLFTLVNNVISNLTQLFWMGVPITQLLKGHGEALQHALAYSRNERRLGEINELLGADYAQGNEKALIQEKLELEAALKDSPIRGMVEAGMMQTIVEDLDPESDAFSYKSRLTKKLEQHTEWVPGWAKGAGKQLFMSRDTVPYQVLHRATQMSDFMSRYVLIQHLTTRADNPMSQDQAMHTAMNAFINYDVPTHKGMQYLNDVGLIFFTKYLLRIQRVIFSLYRDEPARALALLALGAAIPDMANIADSSILEKGPNFSSGAMELPGALDEIIMLQGAMYPFQ